MDAKHIDYIWVRTADTDIAMFPARRQVASIAKDINIGEQGMHRHGTQRSPILVKMKDISHLMAAVTSVLSFFLYQLDNNAWFFNVDPSRSSMPE